MSRKKSPGIGGTIKLSGDGEKLKAAFEPPVAFNRLWKVMSHDVGLIDIKKAGPTCFKAIIYEASNASGESTLQVRQNFVQYHEDEVGPAINYEVIGALTRNLGERALNASGQAAETIT